MRTRHSSYGCKKWLKGLNPRALVKMASDHGIMKDDIMGMAKRLKLIQKMDESNHTIGEMAKQINLNAAEQQQPIKFGA